MAALADGQRFGDYEILGQIGRGGMGTVYKARETGLDRIIALKVLQGELAQDHEYLIRFEREATLAAKLDHPSIVRVLTAGECNGSHFIAMELVEGESVRDRLQRTQRIDPDESIAICVHVAQALDHAWRHAQLVHRDIKPGNIYLSQTGEVKLGDLGLAKSLSDTTAGLTSTGLALGTPNYLSPEQGRGLKEIDFRADIYSLGCTLHHMVTGQPPYPGVDSMAVIHKHIYEPLPPILKMFPACPMPLVMLLGKMMSKHPNGRHQSYEELITDLRRVHDSIQQATGSTGTGTAPAPASRPSRARLWAAGGALAAVACATVLWWAPWRGQPAPETAAPPARAITMLPAPDARPPADTTSPAPAPVPPAAPEAKSPEELVHRVVWKLKEINPAYDGQFSHKVEHGAVVELVVRTDYAADISPLRELKQLQRLSCCGSPESRALATLEPLRGLRLTRLDCGDSSLTDLSPVAGMPLQDFRCAMSRVSSLEPLRGAPLRRLDCFGTRVADLSCLRECPLQWLNCDHTPVSDLSPLRNMPLRALYCSPELAQQQADVIRAISTLETINDEPVAEFLKAMRSGAAPAPASKTPAVAAPPPAAEPPLPPAEQLARAVARLRELNPGFDGRVTHKIENGAVTELSFSTVAVRDISPLASLKGLRRLSLAPWAGQPGRGILADLSPLKGLPLTELWCQNTQVADLSPLQGMPLTTLNCGSTRVNDLVPLYGVPLQTLSCDRTAVADLLPLEGMPLAVLRCDNTKVTDLSPLQKLGLKELHCDFAADRDAGILRGMKTLEKINGLPAAAFWMRQEALRPARAPSPAVAITKPRPVDDAFIRFVAALPPEQQVTRVVEKLKQFNPAFDGQATHVVEDGQVTEFSLCSAGVSDLSPLRALPRLRKLACAGLNDKRTLATLLALGGLALEFLDCSYTQVSDLAPLKGMPLQHLNCGASRVTDLAPLKGAPLAHLNAWTASVADLSPLAGSPLRWLNCKGTRVASLSPLRDTPLAELHCDAALVSQHAAILRAIPTLKIVNGQPYTRP